MNGTPVGETRPTVYSRFELESRHDVTMGRGGGKKPYSEGSEDPRGIGGELRSISWQGRFLALDQRAIEIGVRHLDLERHGL